MYIYASNLINLLNCGFEIFISFRQNDLNVFVRCLFVSWNCGYGYITSSHFFENFVKFIIAPSFRIVFLFALGIFIMPNSIIKYECIICSWDFALVLVCVCVWMVALMALNQTLLCVRWWYTKENHVWYSVFFSLFFVRCVKNPRFD